MQGIQKRANNGSRDGNRTHSSLATSTLWEWRVTITLPCKFKGLIFNWAIFCFSFSWTFPTLKVGLELLIVEPPQGASFLRLTQILHFKELIPSTYKYRLKSCFVKYFFTFFYQSYQWVMTIFKKYKLIGLYLKNKTRLIKKFPLNSFPHTPFLYPYYTRIT